MSSPLRPPSAATSLRVERLVERAMTGAVEEYDDDLAVARLAWLADDDQVALLLKVFAPHLLPEWGASLIWQSNRALHAPRDQLGPV